MLDLLAHTRGFDADKRPCLVLEPMSPMSRDSKSGVLTLDSLAMIWQCPEWKMDNNSNKLTFVKNQFCTVCLSLQWHARRKAGETIVQGVDWRSFVAFLGGVSGDVLWSVRDMPRLLRRESDFVPGTDRLQVVLHPLEVSTVWTPLLSPRHEDTEPLFTGVGWSLHWWAKEARNWKGRGEGNHCGCAFTGSLS